jgi:hypothetical protein
MTCDVRKWVMTSKAFRCVSSRMNGNRRMNSGVKNLLKLKC